MEPVSSGPARGCNATKLVVDAKILLGPERNLDISYVSTVIG